MFDSWCPSSPPTSSTATTSPASKCWRWASSLQHSSTRVTTASSQRALRKRPKRLLWCPRREKVSRRRLPRTRSCQRKLGFLKIPVMARYCLFSFAFEAVHECVINGDACTFSFVNRHGGRLRDWSKPNITLFCSCTCRGRSETSARN